MRTTLFLASLAVCAIANAQSGALDLTFNPTDIGFGNGDGANDDVFTTAVQSDGKIIIAGSFTSYNGTSTNRIARLNSDGTLDLSFNPGTGANGSIYTTVLQSDGKIIIGGNFTSYNDTARNYIARLNSDGTLDLSFNPGTGASDNVSTTTLQSDGKIIIGGWFTSYNGTSTNRIARLNSDGTLDLSFNPGTGANGSISTTVLQSDGKIIIGGNFTSYNGTSTNRIARLNSDGTLDLSFNPGTGANNTIRTTALQGDGKIIIGGYFTSYNDTARNYIARLNGDGTLDLSFNLGTGANSTVNTTTLQSDGKIIIGGHFMSYNGTAINRIARLNSDGTLDPSFTPGAGANERVDAIVLQSDGKIIIGGYFASYNGTARGRIARLNSDGTLDLSLNPGTGVNDLVWATALQSDGKIIIGGYFTSYNGTVVNRIARLNGNGTLDMSFNTGTGANNTVWTTAAQKDGKIIIGGNFTSYNDTARICIARLNSDGTLDLSFNPGTGANGTVLTTVLQSDGKIIIGGGFTSYNGTAINRIARLNSDGTLDPSFNPGIGANSSVNTTVLQSDGKIIIGGNFTSYNGTSINRIARLISDGTLDLSFNPGTGVNGTVLTTVLQSDGKIIIGGQFNFYNGTAINRIARLNSNGALDLSFNPGSGTNLEVFTSAVQSDGKIIIGGTFNSYDGTAINHIARLNGDGTLDLSFNLGTGANSTVNTTILQSDGKIIIGGRFTSYNGIGRNRIARLLNCPANITNTFSISEPSCDTTNGTVTATPSGGTGPYTYQWNNGATEATITGIAGSPTDTLIVTITDGGGCALTDTVLVACLTGIDRHGGEQIDFAVYPNPGGGEFYIVTSEMSYEVTAVNMLGEKVLHHTVANGSASPVIDLRNEPEGIYLLLLTTKEGMVVKKVVVRGTY